MPPKTREQAAEDTLNAVVASSFKLPQFYDRSPDVWFSFVESQFFLRGIEDDQSKFAYVVTALNPEVSTLVRDVIAPAPATDKYDTIKSRLLKEFTLTPAERAAELLDLPGLGDQRPSQLLSKMLALLPPDEHANPSILFKELFVRQLPAEIRHHIMDKYDLKVRQLAEEADRFFTITGARVAAVRTAAPPAGPAPRRGGFYCYFHARFGERARKCESPCAYRPGN